MKTRSPFSLEDITVVVQTLDNREYGGLVVESTVDGDEDRVRIDFPLEDSPVLPIGEEAALIFSGGSLQAPTLAFGEVVHRSEDPFRARYNFRLCQKLGTVLAYELDRRGEPRVHPATEAWVGITVPADGSEMRFTLHDISATGVSFLIPREEEPGLAPVWELELALSLPGEAEELELGGLIRRRELREVGILYGVEFDPRRTEGFAERQERIRAYVQGILDG